MQRSWIVGSIALLFVGDGLVRSEGAKTAEALATACRPSIVVVSHSARDGKRQGLGAGFVVDKAGLIATNFHVIGEGRPISVQLADGRRLDVTAVHASDRALDLAILKVAATDLVPLPLGDSTKVKDGQAVVALGHPHGLRHSVVTGVVSGKRVLDGMPMIQLAIPIEQGNSGGPLIDMEGRVQGILTMKSAITANLGFAVEIDAIKPLLKKPNPIPMARWQTLGALDPAEWQTVMGANWRSRGGRIAVEGAGTGFGGRSLCLAQSAASEVPYEVGVNVRLQDEAGAAGLVFQSDGGDVHYGFYPSGGQVRLTHFQGPDVFSWKILRQLPCPSYRPGEWNALRVRVEKDKIQCFVNNELATEVSAEGLGGGKPGLAKFRETKAEFRGFQVGKALGSGAATKEQRERVGKLLAEHLERNAIPESVMVDLAKDAPVSLTLMQEQARKLEQQAAQLRGLAMTVHRKRVREQLTEVFHDKDEEVDLLRAALLLAKLDNEDLDIEGYRRQVERMARELKDKFPADANEATRLLELNRYFFAEQGFHGSRTDYYNRSNSYMSDLLDDREGLPITLAVLFMDLGRRIGLKLEGVGLPGHFVVRHQPKEGKPALIDVFDGGKALTREEAEEKVKATTGRAARAEHFKPVSKRAIVARMLSNLLRANQQEESQARSLAYLDTLIELTPDASEERGLRAALKFQLGDKVGALQDIDWLLDKRPAGVDVERLLEFRRAVEQSGK